LTIVSVFACLKARRDVAAVFGLLSLGLHRALLNSLALTHVARLECSELWSIANTHRTLGRDVLNRKRRTIDSLLPRVLNLYCCYSGGVGPKIDRAARRSGGQKKL